MKIVTISDIHLTNSDHEAISLWEKFVYSKETSEADTVILLGDIFDLMIGEKNKYIKYYSFFFDSIKYLILSGKKIIYLEGNHDFHLNDVFNSFLKENKLDKTLFEYKKNEFYMNINQKRYLFCHGDIIDYENEGFKKWKKIYTSLPFKVLINKVLPFQALIKLGDKASQDSKKRNRKDFNYADALEKYRDGARYIFKKTSVDIIIAGHTHVKDEYRFDNDKIYLNNGFPKKHKCFISISDKGNQLIALY